MNQTDGSLQGAVSAWCCSSGVSVMPLASSQPRMTLRFCRHQRARGVGLPPPGGSPVGCR
jgi:hypothetical protein